MTTIATPLAIKEFDSRYVFFLSGCLLYEGPKESIQWTCRGGDKRPCYQYSAISILFKSEDPSGEGQLHLKPIGSIQVVFQTMSGSQVSRAGCNGRVLVRPCRVFGMGIHSMPIVMDQKGQHLKVFQELVFVMVRWNIFLESSPEVSWLFRQSQKMLLTRLQFLRCVLIVGRIVILLWSSLDFSWSTNQGQIMFLTRLRIQVFSMIIQRFFISPKIIPTWYY